MSWTVHAARMVMRNAYRGALIGKPEGKSPNLSWENNIKIGFKEIGCV